VRFIDDLDGSDAVGTVTFSLENRAYLDHSLGAQAGLVGRRW
jgi:hypothetical protein